MMKSKLNKIVSLAGAAVTAPITHGAQAQTTVMSEIVVRDTAPTPRGYEVTQSAAATKSATALRDVPQIVNVVPQALMRDQNAMSVQDALQNVPGLSFSVGDALVARRRPVRRVDQGRPRQARGMPCISAIAPQEQRAK